MEHFLVSAGAEPPRASRFRGRGLASPRHSRPIPDRARRLPELSRRESHTERHRSRPNPPGCEQGTSDSHRSGRPTGWDARDRSTRDSCYSALSLRTASCQCSRRVGYPVGIRWRAAAVSQRRPTLHVVSADAPSRDLPSVPQLAATAASACSAASPGEPAHPHSGNEAHRKGNAGPARVRVEGQDGKQEGGVDQDADKYESRDEVGTSTKAQPPCRLGAKGQSNGQNAAGHHTCTEIGHCYGEELPRIRPVADGKILE